MYIKPILLLKLLHLSSRELLDVVHAHVHHQVLIQVHQAYQSVKRPLRDWVEAYVDQYQFRVHSQFREQLDSTVVLDAALLESEFLELFAERGCSSDHLAPVVFDQGVAHVD